MKYKFVRKDDPNITVEIESSGKVGGDGSLHLIKIGNPTALMFWLNSFSEYDFGKEIEAIEFGIKGDWELSEAINALKYILWCLKIIDKGDDNDS